MVVISCAVLSRSGRVLLARQFVSITKSRLDGYLAAFPKLIGLSGNSSGPVEAQHTFVETENIRYVYQPMDGLLIVLITNKQSNILEDLDTLRLMAKLVPECCGGVTEDHLIKKQFELIFSIDELLTSGGHKESVTLQQIKTFTEMDSHEEKLQKIILESKINEAKDEAVRKAESIAKLKAEAKKLQQGSEPSGKFLNPAYGSPSAVEEDYRPPSKDSVKPTRPSASVESSKPKGSGMQLSKAKKTDEFFTSLSKEEKLAPAPLRPGQKASAAQISSGEVRAEKVRLVVAEKISGELEREGGVKRCEAEGELKVAIFDPDHGRILVKTNGALKEIDGWKCRLHPKINKALWGSDGIIGLADPAKPFPVGSENAQTVLKWRKGAVESPITFSVNPWSEGGRTSVTAEYHWQGKSAGLHSVVVRIPCPASEQPEVSNVEGEWKFDPKRKEIVWKIPEVGEENPTGALEFSVPELGDEVFFPCSVEFESLSTLSGLEISSIVHVEDSSRSIPFEAEISLAVEKLLVVEQ